MKHKVGDRVKVKSLDWYNFNKDDKGDVVCGRQIFVNEMSIYCGKTLTIERVSCGCFYGMVKVPFCWTDEMFEGLADEEQEIQIADGFEFRDENGNVIKTSKITLAKKKPKYPTSYEECCNIIKNPAIVTYGYRRDLIYNLQKLLICRDAYWKIAGDEMGLDKPWEPNWTDNNEVKFIIGVAENEIIKCYNGIAQYILAFPTSEMRDIFCENFKDLINECKELL